MLKQLPITELDFDQIKSALKAHYTRSDSPFKDWNFEGSGLSNLLDVLAYNTHYNAMLAHMTANETFLRSAQLRKNVVARAQTLGYIPHSITAPSTIITLGGEEIANLGEVPAGTTFTTTVNDKQYVYTTLESIQGNFAEDEASDIPRKTVTAYQGSMKTITYIFDGSSSKQVFEIPDQNVDIAHVTVTSTVANTDNLVNYTRFTELGEADAESEIYFISENPSGLYEIQFGNNVIGKRPAADSVITISYLTTLGAESNGATLFTLQSTLTDVYDNPLTITIESNTTSDGGGDRENIEQIRLNAPLAFQARDNTTGSTRAVTANDYKSIVQNNSSADYVSVWGSEDLGGDLSCDELGTVYISAKRNDTTNSGFLSDIEKEKLLDIFKNKAVLTLRHVFVNPEVINLYFQVFVKYDDNLTALSSNSLASKVLTSIGDFGAANMSNFGSMFRYSKFMAHIDNSDPSILNSTVRVFAYKTYSATAGTNTVYIDYTFPLDTDDDLSSSKFTYAGKSYQIESYGNITLNKKNVRLFYLDSADAKQIVGDIGTLNYYTGVLDITTPFNVTSATDIKFFVRPASDNIAGKTNNILQIDSGSTTVTASICKMNSLGNAAATSSRPTPRDP